MLTYNKVFVGMYILFFVRVYYCVKDWCFDSTQTLMYGRTSVHIIGGS